MKRNKNGSITLSRQELYKLVWSKPIVQLAKEYGLSDRGLAKICQRHGIPRPPRGYWAKRQHGHSPRQTPLPKIKEPRKAKITIWPSQISETSIRSSRRTSLEILVPKEIVDLHPLVARTEKSLRSARKGEKGLVTPRAKKALRVSVAPESVDRASRILDTLIKELEKRGFSVQTTVDENRTSRTTVDVDGEEIEFLVTEKVDREERELSQRELRAKERNPWRFRYPEYRYIPTGVLSLRILTIGAFRRTRTWSDLKKRPLERRLGLFVEALEPISAAIKRERSEAEERRKRWAEEERRRKERRLLIHQEEERLKHLAKQVEDWHQSRRIRTYVAAVREAAFDSGGQIVDEEELNEWIAWATSQAARLDPLAKSPPSILDEKPKR